MERNAKPHSCRKLVWLAIAYTGVIAMVLYPALHEGLGIETSPVELHCANTRLTRDCDSTRQIQAAQDRLDHFSVLAAIVAIFFSAARFFTPL